MEKKRTRTREEALSPRKSSKKKSKKSSDRKESPSRRRSRSPVRRRSRSPPRRHSDKDRRDRRSREQLLDNFRKWEERSSDRRRHERDSQGSSRDRPRKKSDAEMAEAHSDEDPEFVKRLDQMITEEEGNDEKKFEEQRRRRLERLKQSTTETAVALPLDPVPTESATSVTPAESMDLELLNGNGNGDAGHEDSKQGDSEGKASDDDKELAVTKTGYVPHNGTSNADPCEAEFHDTAFESALAEREAKFTGKKMALSELPPITTVAIVDDMFSDSPVKVVPQDQIGLVQAVPLPIASEVTLIDDWDDAEGYYKFRVELLEGRYNVYALAGRGVFSSVVLARDTKRQDSVVAIKIIRNNESMHRAGLKELGILNDLKNADPENRRYCVRLLAHFEHRNHLCLVFEPLAMNLRQVLKKYGSGIGISISAIRKYTHQILVAVKHMHSCDIIHADIKPDNILVNDKKNICKLSDFGSAFSCSEADITPYLCSRFYRPPEIILGLQYGKAVDMWSVGCTLFELYTGQYAFPGRSNNEMMKLIMDLKGRMPPKLLRKAQFKNDHFDADLNLLFRDIDRATNQERTRVLTYPKPTRDLKEVLLAVAETDPADRRRVNQFVDLLNKMFTLDPAQRITATEALKHAFLID